SGKREAKLLISGEHFTMHFRNGDVYVGTFSLDAAAHPRAMDMTITEGPDAHRGKTSLAIYEFDGDHLIWCPAEPGREDPLRAFPGHEDCGLCIIFKRRKNGPPACLCRERPPCRSGVTPVSTARPTRR